MQLRSSFDVPGAARWTVPTATYAHSTLVVNFSDPSLPRQLALCIKVWCRCTCTCTCVDKQAPVTPSPTTAVALPTPAGCLLGNSLPMNRDLSSPLPA